MIAALGLVCGSVSGAVAQDAVDATAEPDPITEPGGAMSNDARARVFFDRGLHLASEDRHTEALELFRQSMQLVPRASTALNLAIELQRLGRGREALAVLDALPELSPSDQDRADERTLRARILPSLATLIVRIGPTDIAEAAELTVDGEVVPSEGRERTVLLDPGSHRIAVAATGHLTERRSVTLLAGTSADERFELRSAAPDAVAAQAHEADPTPEVILEEPPPRRLWIAGVVAGVVVVAAVIVTAVLLAGRDPQLYGGTFPGDDVQPGSP